MAWPFCFLRRAQKGDSRMDWLTDNKIPLGKWIQGFVEFLNDHAAWFFDGISEVLGFLIDGLTDLLQFTPPLLLVAKRVGSGRRSRSARS